MDDFGFRPSFCRRNTRPKVFSNRPWGFSTPPPVGTSSARGLARHNSRLQGRSKAAVANSLPCRVRPQPVCRCRHGHHVNVIRHQAVFPDLHAIFTAPVTLLPRKILPSSCSACNLHVRGFAPCRLPWCCIPTEALAVRLSRTQSAGVGLAGQHTVEDTRGARMARRKAVARYSPQVRASSRRYSSASVTSGTSTPRLRPLRSHWTKSSSSS